MQNLWQFGVLGLVSGGAYSLIALGFLAVYKGSRVVNLSQVSLGMAGSYVFWGLYDNGHGWPVAPAIAVAVLVSAVFGGVIYLGIMRVVRNAAEIVRMITSLGILITLEALAQQHYGSDVASVGAIFGSHAFDIFGAKLSSAAVVVLIALVIMAFAISFLFRRTSLGAKATALQDNPNAASSVGISPHPTGTITWAIGAACATIAGIVLLPGSGLSPTGLNGSLVPALAAVLVARFSSVSVTVAAGLAFGVLESIGIDRGYNAGLTNSLPFFVIVVVLFARGRSLPNRDETKFKLPAVGTGRISLPWTILILVLSYLLVSVLGGTWIDAVTTSATTAIIGLSVVVVTGYAGQLNLAPLAMAGLSALTAAQLAIKWHWGFLPAVIAGTVVGGLVGLIVATPAVRVRGTNLAIATLGLASAIETIFLDAPRFTGGTYGLTVPDPKLFGWAIDTGNHPSRYAYVCVAGAALSAIIVANIRSNSSGRRYAAIRSSERGAAALGVSVAGSKLAAFATAGLLCGLAGGLMAFRFSAVGFQSFQLFPALTLVGLVIVGGVGLISGGLLASVIGVGGISSLFVLQTLGLGGYEDWIAIFSGLFIIYTMLVYPDGAMEYNIRAGHELRRKLLGDRTVIKKRFMAPEALPSAETAAGITQHAAELPVYRDNLERAGRLEVTLVVDKVAVQFGGVKALEGVSFEAVAGQVLGVIGPNGAGKTTLIDVISGFRRPSRGAVRFLDAVLPAGRPQATAAKGISRTFQNLELFDDLTVRENLMIATEKFSTMSYFANAVLRRKPHLSNETLLVLRTFGLDESLQMKAGDLPQGKRRLLAVARALAQNPAVLCLDEPAAGVSPAERPALGQMIRSFAKDLGVAVILVEHDVDLVASVCDRLLVLDFGREIALGLPAEVLASDVVRAAYLGRATEEAAEAGAEPLSPTSGLTVASPSTASTASTTTSASREI